MFLSGRGFSVKADQAKPFSPCKEKGGQILRHRFLRQNNRPDLGKFRVPRPKNRERVLLAENKERQDRLHIGSLGLLPIQIRISRRIGYFRRWRCNPRPSLLPGSMRIPTGAFQCLGAACRGER